MARDPSDHEKYFNLARACEKLEQWDEMADALRAATRLAPEFANYWWKLGQASMHEGHLRTAQRALETCILKDPNLALCHHDLGVVHQRTNEPRQALMRYRDAIRADPERGRSYVEAASLYFALRRYREARITLEAATALGPSLYDAADRCEVHELLADLALVRSDRDSALGELERAVRLSNSVPWGRCSTVRFRLGYLRATGKTPKPEIAKALLTEFRKRQCTKYLPSNTKAECAAATALLKELASKGKHSRQP